MKRLIPLVVLCAALCGCGKVIPADDEVAVVPLPERVVKGQGTFLLTASTEAVLLSGDDSLACVTGGARRSAGTGVRQRVAGAACRRALDGALNISCDAAMPADGYRLEITPGRAEIVGGSAAGGVLCGADPSPADPRCGLRRDRRACRGAARRDDRGQTVPGLPGHDARRLPPFLHGRRSEGGARHHGPA